VVIAEDFPELLNAMNFSSGSTIKTKQVFKKTNPYVAASL
jgi:hypothetical protein